MAEDYLYNAIGGKAVSDMSNREALKLALLNSIAAIQTLRDNADKIHSREDAHVMYEAYQQILADLKGRAILARARQRA